MTTNDLPERELWLFKSYWDDSDVEAVTDVIRRGTWWAKGDEIDEFERLISNETDTEYAVAFNSGTSALYALLLANDITDGEVIVPSYTFQATANAVEAVGATPVFADIERDSLALAADSVREKITEDTRAIMPIHFGGDIAADIFELQEIAAENDCLLFEDACHSPTATYRGEPVGSFGDAAAFSFCFNKIITTGEGGMVVTDSEEMRNRLRQIRSHGESEDGKYVTWGHNFRLSSMAAALGVSQAKKLDEIVETRRDMAQTLNEHLNDIAGVETPRFPEERESVYQLYNIIVENKQTREELASYLDENGIPTRNTYSPVHLSHYYREKYQLAEGDLPVTEEFSNRVLTLPFHMFLDDSDLKYIAHYIRNYFC